MSRSMYPMLIKRRRLMTVRYCRPVFSCIWESVPSAGAAMWRGGTTSTKIQYNEDNPYEKNAKSLQAEAFKGNNVDVAV